LTTDSVFGNLFADLFTNRSRFLFLDPQLRQLATLFDPALTLRA
jgi:hypothetical protein